MGHKLWTEDSNRGSVNALEDDERCTRSFSSRLRTFREKNDGTLREVRSHIFQEFFFFSH